jgi:hypothetical protein
VRLVFRKSVNGSANFMMEAYSGQK